MSIRYKDKVIASDGFSPIVTAEPNETNTGTIVTITDAEGPKEFEVLNGQDATAPSGGFNGYVLAKRSDEDGDFTWQKPSQSLVLDEILTFTEMPTFATDNSNSAKKYYFYDGVFNRTPTKADVPSLGFGFGKYTDEEEKTTWFCFEWNFYEYLETTGRCTLTCQNFQELPWNSGAAFPEGGHSGQVLGKLSEEDNEVGWIPQPLMITSALWSSSIKNAQATYENVGFSYFNRELSEEEAGKTPGIGWGYFGGNTVDKATHLVLFNFVLYQVNMATKMAMIKKTQNIIVPISTILEAGNGLTQEETAISVTTPVQRIVTQEEYDALNEEERNKGLWIIKDEGESSSSGSPSSGGEIYSTEEVRIGTWIDGKPLYRRCIEKELIGQQAAENTEIIYDPNINICKAKVLQYTSNAMDYYTPVGDYAKISASSFTGMTAILITASSYDYRHKIMAKVITANNNTPVTALFSVEYTKVDDLEVT